MNERVQRARPRIAVDVGGTFIDFVLFDPDTGAVVVEKQPATPNELAAELIAGLSRLPVPASEISQPVHGSTVAINALVQERGATVGHITTRGFWDVLEIGRGNRPEMGNWLYVPPRPLVPRDLRGEVAERTAANGDVLVPVDLDELLAISQQLVGDGAEALSVCFLNSYANPANEQDAARHLRECLPGVPVTASSDISSEWHEFERTYTTVINAYIQPLFEAYIAELLEHLRAVGYDKELPVMQSNGRVITAGRAAMFPVRTVQSGPAGGVIGVQAVLRKLDIANAICTDVGGTTFDVALIQDGQILERSEFDVGGRPILAPAIDIVSVGAGGGSIAWIDDSGALRVGPQSAGALPGPVVFGRGGQVPTVTDCQFLLGRLDPDTFLGARMSLDLESARLAVQKHLAEPLGMSVEDVALGVLTLAGNNMGGAIHEMIVGRAVDPREFTIVAYGGGGGQFAVATAEEVGAAGVLVPHAPATFSAWGILGADFREDAARTSVRQLAAGLGPALAADLHDMRDETTSVIVGFGFEQESVRIEYRADLRFAGQEHTITVQLPDSWLHEAALDALPSRLGDEFAQEHRAIYGHGDALDPMEVVTLRCRAIGPNPSKPWFPEPSALPSTDPSSRRVCFQDHGFVETLVVRRTSIAAGEVLAGPVVVEEWNSSLLIPPGWRGECLAGGELHIARVSSQ